MFAATPLVRRLSTALPASAIALALLGTATPAIAQLNSNIANVTLNAVLAEQLTVSVTGGSTVNFALSPGGDADGDVPVSITTSWTLGLLRTSVSLYGYFDTPTAALTDGSENILAASVLGRMTSGIPITYLPFVETNLIGPAAGSLLLFTEVVALLNLNDSRSDNLDLRIALAAQPQLPAGSYTGTLHLRAQAL
ncbi:MAG: hypothetical protein FD129_1899 [bacterium]|nr:MAG: hypothetical protein FD129_1899 [bacterium]